MGNSHRYELRADEVCRSTPYLSRGGLGRRLH
jgi:hypothetical protein